MIRCRRCWGPVDQDGEWTLLTRHPHPLTQPCRYYFLCARCSERLEEWVRSHLTGYVEELERRGAP